MTVVALTPDLMDRSKVTAAIDGVVHVGAAALLARAVDEETELVIVDATKAGALEAITNLSATCRVVAFGPHVDDDLLAAATAAGAEAMPRSRFFHQLDEGAFTPRKQSGNSPSSS